MKEIVIYEDGKFSIEIPINEDTLWLSAEQIATVFGVHRPAIIRHSTCSILEQDDDKR